MNKNRKKGFTLVELLVVISILAILTSVTIVGYVKFVEKARLSNDEQLVSQINNLIKAEDTYTLGTSNDALEIQNILKEQGIKEIKTQSKGNYIFFDNVNRRAVLASLDDNGINVIYGDTTSDTTKDSALRINSSILKESNNTSTNNTSSKGQYLDLIYSPESFIDGYTFITTSSRDGIAENIVNIRNGGGNLNIRESKLSIKNSIINIKKNNEEVGTLIENMSKYACFVNSNQEQIIMNGTSKRDIVVMIFSSDITKLEKYGFENIDDMSLTMIDVPSSVNTIDTEAIETLANTDKLSNISISTSNDELYKDVKNKINETSLSYDKCKKILDTFTKTENRNKELTNVKVDFKNSIDGVTDYSSYLTKSVVLNVKSNSIQVSPKMDIEYLKEKSLTYPNLYFDGFYINDSKLDESIGKFEFDKSKYQNGYPSEINVISKWKTSFASPKFKTFAYVCYYNYSQDILTYSDSIMLSLINSNQIDELFFDIPNTSNSDSSIEYGGEQGGYVVYPTSDVYELNVNLTIPDNVTLWLPYSNDFDNLDKVPNNFRYFYASDGSYLGSSKQIYGCDYTNDSNNKNSDGTYTKKIKINAILNNYGNIRIGATLYARAGGIDTGEVAGNYGMIENYNELNNYGNLYAIGVLDNQKSFTSYSGSVYEEMTIGDWFGGKNAAGCVVGNVAPFNEWKLTSIKGSATFNNDSNYYASMLVYAASSFNVGNLPIIGVNSLFNLNDNNASIVKNYSSNVENGKLIFNLYGNISDSKVSLNLGFSGATDVPLNKIPFPISNMGIVLEKGCNLTLSSNKYKVLPDSYININEGANLTISTSFALYEKFIREDCTKKGIKSYYVDSKGNKKDLEGAYIINKGTLTLSGSNTEFSGDIKQCGGKIEIKDDFNKFTTEFKEGYGVKDDSGCGGSYKLTEETNLQTGSFNDETFTSQNKTKIIINDEDKLITSLDDLKNIENVVCP